MDHDVPHPDRFPPDTPGYEETLAAHRRASGAGEAGYLDPRSGLFVMTATYLLNRGWCCDRGCRHCPYVGGGERTGPDDSNTNLPAADAAGDEETR